MVGKISRSVAVWEHHIHFKKHSPTGEFCTHTFELSVNWIEMQPISPPLSLKIWLHRYEAYIVSSASTPILEMHKTKKPAILRS